MTAATETTKTLPRLKSKYREQVVPALREQYKYGNPMQIPGLVKVVVNMGVGEAARDAKLIDGAVRDLTTITGQKPLVRRATKSIAQFKLREGMPIGAKVTLRGDRMWEFLDRLLSIALPRIRDFRGLDGRKLDGHGNYTFGLTEQSVFHEIDQDRIDRIRGMDITVVTTPRPTTRAGRCSSSWASHSRSLRVEPAIRQGELTWPRRR
jgi:large subunit ribosomal protein L5